MSALSDRAETPASPPTNSANSNTQRPGRTVVRRAIDEAERYLWFALYLIVIFGTLILFCLNIYARVDQEVPHFPSHHFYALGLINALVFAKMMLIAESSGLGSSVVGRRLEEGRLATLILYRALAFTVVLVAAYALEEVLVGAWHGKAVGEVLPEIAGGPAGLATLAWVMFVALIPYFAYRELGRVLGEDRLRSLLVGPRAAT
ncbi:hypothetical protein [Methylobacterium sp. ID0610]|uniref:hypothetical protein n=1 Tax=Methylobacterium carpenticola TaxID=3344827 RepID=UPI00369DF6AF